MVDRVSALATNYTKGYFEVDKKITLTFREIKDLYIKQIAAWPLTIDAIDSKLANLMNTTNAPGFNQSFSKDNKHVLRIEPLKWWIIGDDTIETNSNEGAIIDLSHAFTSIEVRGESAKKFLNRHLPLDFRDDSFPNNYVASSAIHHVSVKVWKINQGYRIFIPRGFALSLWEIFLETAHQFGYEIL